MKLVGLMSGTSLDGIDALLLEIRGSDPGALEWEALAGRTYSYARERQDEIRAAVESGGPRELAMLHVRLGEWMAEAVLALLEETGTPAGEVRAVGSHGQTLWHEPPADGRRGASLQLGDPATLAERTGIDVVSDFRSRDVAAGGHGAPLVPWADRILFSHPERRRALQNLGGMGNVTRLPPAGSGEPLVAFDTGPGVSLLDAAARLATGGRESFDEGGRMADAGRVDEELVERLLRHAFFHEEPPKTTGREVFGMPLVVGLARERGLEEGDAGDGWNDLLATFVAVTARSVAEAYGRWVLPRGVDEVFLTGGGARNPVLARALKRELDPLEVRPGEELPLDPDFREAAAFALMAWAHVQGFPASIPEATGARAGRLLGSLTPGRPG